jgi:hypothetical protein
MQCYIRINLEISSKDDDFKLLFQVNLYNIKLQYTLNEVLTSSCRLLELLYEV